MFTKEYRNYLQSPAWGRKREECFAIHGKRCKACGKGHGPIHVHHLDYTRLYKESAKTDLVPLCADCHKSVTKIYRSNRRRGLRRVTWEYIYAKQRLIKQRRNG